jgi:Holliday junction resolvase-like predicted endonuclease
MIYEIRIPIITYSTAVINVESDKEEKEVLKAINDHDSDELLRLCDNYVNSHESTKEVQSILDVSIINEDPDFKLIEGDLIEAENLDLGFKRKY